jgi:NAD(P)-dependent dehydrogenase (short-subunit alcohol dehydrogenase family)
MGVIWGVEIFGPLIERHGEGGHIVNTASVAGLISSSRTPNAYQVTKYGVVSLSESLREVLAPRGIGVSVLCPGLVRTNIVDSARNLQDRYADAALALGAAGDPPAWIIAIRDQIAAGADPLYVGDLVREGIEGDWPYIFTDTQFEPLIDARFANIKAGFDRIREREPRR